MTVAVGRAWPGLAWPEGRGGPGCSGRCDGTVLRAPAGPGWFDRVVRLDRREGAGLAEVPRGAGLGVPAWLGAVGR